MLVTERPGRLRIVRNGTLLPTPVAGLPPIRTGGQGGLLDVVPHPNFAANRLLYISYAKPSADTMQGTTAVIRARFENDRLTNVQEIFEAAAWTTGRGHHGSRLAFDRDGFLFITVGDRQVPPAGDLKAHPAQDLGNHHGKILRLHDDGKVPADNPFVGRAGAKPEIWSYGHRNMQGLLIHPVTNEVWATEHGPQGGDELNLIKRGANFGWPVVSYGRKYSGEIISEQPWREEIDAPRFFWVPSIGISGVLFYTGDRFPEWKGQMIVTGMNGMLIQRVRLEGRGSTERESMLTQLRQEFRDIQQGPDGLIYLVTREDAAGTPSSGMVLRIEPVE
jgi:glucose/arabinose dehydrogenase